MATARPIAHQRIFTPATCDLIDQLQTALEALPPRRLFEGFRLRQEALGDRMRLLEDVLAAARAWVAGDDGTDYGLFDSGPRAKEAFKRLREAIRKADGR